MEDIKINEDELLDLKMSDDLLRYVCRVIDVAQEVAYRAVNVALIKRNWLIGYRIATEELKDKTRSENYGLSIIKNLSKELSKKYGNGFSKTNLYNYYMFYKLYENFFHTVCGKSSIILSWSHYRCLLLITDDDARLWYEKEAIKETWSVRTLQRNISSQYYYRILKTSTIKEKQELDGKYNNLEFIKNPLTLEFLGLANNLSFTEADLESSIISNLQSFLMELGKGYSFVGRQYHIHTEKSDYYIDLVFYNYIIKCFVLVDLKIGKITHQDVGQMDMYVRMFDKLKKLNDDNSTIGIVLCTDTDEDIAKYSILNDNNKLFASKYKLYLPTEEELRREIELQKELFYLQQLEKDYE